MKEIFPIDMVALNDVRGYSIYATRSYTTDLIKCSTAPFVDIFKFEMDGAIFNMRVTVPVTRVF